MEPNKDLQVLVATMHRNDFSLVEKMNINCDAIIANQDSRNYYDECTINGCQYKMITTDTIGVGRNRNIALIHCTGDFLLFSDDDIVYKNDMADHVVKAFESLPNADVIIFGIDFTLNGVKYSTRCPRTKRLHWFSSLRYGTAVLCIRRDSLLKKHMAFTELFGGGCRYSHGEDSDFILQCFRNGLSVFSFSYVLGSTAKDNSTCFEGYNEKYFYDTGALAKNTFGIVARLYMMYMAIRTRDKSALSFATKIKLLNAGFKHFDDLISYEKWKDNNGN